MNDLMFLAEHSQWIAIWLLTLVIAYCLGDLRTHKRHMAFLEEQIAWLKSTFEEDEPSKPPNIG